MVSSEWSIVNRQWSKDAKKAAAAFRSHGFSTLWLSLYLHFQIFKFSNSAAGGSSLPHCPLKHFLPGWLFAIHQDACAVDLAGKPGGEDETGDQ